MDIGIQVNNADIEIPFVNLIDTPQKSVSTMTGIPTFELLEKIIEIYKSEFPDKRMHHMTYKDRIIMTFLKLKQDLSCVVLSILFKNITAESCRLIYSSILLYPVIPSMAKILGCSIYWPSKEEIIANITYCFKKFPNTRIILDCTEIPVQKPKCLTCRFKLYSNYKSILTLKFLIGISPGGIITYISKPYGGRASDKSILEQSGLIQKMNSSMQ